MNLTEEQYLAHYGVLRRSGRYPWGSHGPERAGSTQPARNRQFLDMVNDLKKQGLSETEICVGMKIGTVDHFGVFHPSTTQLRAARSIAKNQQKLARISQAQTLREKGLSNGAIAAKMGLPGESSVRALLAPGARDASDILISTANMLKSEVADKKYVDVGRGTESHIGSLGISKERLNTAVSILKEDGYQTHRIKRPQIGTQFDTDFKVLVAPGVTWKEVQQNQDLIQQIGAVSKDYGRTFDDGKIHDPLSVHPNRIDVRYKEDGGANADGVIFVRPGVADVSLGSAHYAQVRVKVGSGHFLKGMAMYKDDLPEGIDLQFNTSKSDTGNKLDAMKELTSSKEYPFKTVVRQQKEKIGNTDKERVTSAMNIVNEEGDWGKWQRTLASQVLSKQNPVLARTQLNMTFERRQKEFDEIQALTNPVVKKKLLEKFAESTDAAAVHLKAAALNSRQRWHAILPIESMSPTQIYAPNYNDGERVVLLRYPHAGTFEIPELTVNNKHPEAKRLLGNAEDAVGIHHSVAKHLSGADFDGDTVIVIPNNQNRIGHSPALEELQSFDPLRYKLPADSPIPRITADLKQQEMGKISNLIADMTIGGAPHSEIAHAVKHSMVVIDSEKHELNYKQSFLDNGIAHLKAKYQGDSAAGASTIISRAKAKTFVLDRKPRPQSEGGPIDKATGKKVFVETGKTRTGPKGDQIPKRIRSRQLAETDDAHTLLSPDRTQMERLYADHSNRLKSMANEARLAASKAPPLQRSASAKKAYAPEVQSLKSKLLLAKRNAPLERQALVIARASVRAKKDANPDLDSEALRKILFEEQVRARDRTGAKKKLVDITPKEWDAIQAGAISTSHLTQILNNTDIETVRVLATPRREHLMTSTKTARAKAMLASGHTRAEVAAQLGVSLTTLDLATKG